MGLLTCKLLNRNRFSVFFKMCVCVVESHLILCDPMDCSLPGSSVDGISQVRRQPVGNCCVTQGAQIGAL